MPSGICYRAGMTTYETRYGLLLTDEYQIDVCESCLLCREADSCDATYCDDSADCPHWARIPGTGYDTFIAQSCTDDGCDCQETHEGHGFMSSACDACGDHLAGDRHPYMVARIIPSDHVRLFVSGYLEAMVWANVADEDSGAWQAYDIADDSLNALECDARDFLASNYADIESAVNGHDGYGFDSAGHDYALTRNGHGAGYWDRGLGDVGDSLTDMAQAAGCAYLIPDDDGWLILE